METTNHSPPLPCLSSVPPSDRETTMPYRTPLDWLNFFLADVRGGLGPYVGTDRAALESGFDRHRGHRFLNHRSGAPDADRRVHRRHTMEAWGCGRRRRGAYCQRPDPCGRADGPLLARLFVQRSDQIACVHMFGLFSRSHMNAGQDGFRDASSKHPSDLWRPVESTECLASWIDRSHHLLVALQVLASAQHGCR